MKIVNIFWVATFSVILFLSACTKEENVGEDLIALPGDTLGVRYVDTLTLQTYSVWDDSVRSDETSLNLLGSYYDNVFGTSTAGFYTQLRLATNNINFGTNATCDSVVLALKYSALYGDSMFYNVIKVYELIDPIYKDSAYYMSMPAKIVDATELANTAVKFAIKDSVTLNGLKTAPHLRIKLDKSFAEKIMAKSGQTELSNNDEFIKFIKGLYVTANKQNAGGCIASFDLVSSISQVTIYYRNSQDTALKINLLINENCARIGRVDHDQYLNANTDFRNQVINGNQSLGEQKLYIQALGGVKTFIKIPHLTELVKNHKIALHKAELILNVEAGSIANIKPNENLALVKIDADGVSQFLEDQLSEPSSYFGGTYNSTNNQYTFTITRHLQSILSGDQIHYGLRLMATGSAIKANRVVLNGPKSASSPMKLKLMYTIVE